MNAPSKFGLIRNEPIETYHSTDAWSKTKLDDFRELPLLAYKKHVERSIPREPLSEAFKIGQCAHSLILEGGDAYRERAVVVPADAPRRPTKAQLEAKKPSEDTIAAIAWWKTFNEVHAGKMQITAEEEKTHGAMHDAVRAQPTAAALLAHGEAELTFRVMTNRGPSAANYALQCRPDWFCADGASLELVGLLKSQGITMDVNEPYVCDLKTVNSLSELNFSNFTKHFALFRYYRSGPFYTAVMRDVLGKLVTKFFFIVVEAQAPYSCAVFLADDKANEIGWSEIVTDLQRLNECYDSGIWPGVPSAVQTITLPSWFVRKSDEGGAL